MRTNRGGVENAVSTTKRIPICEPDISALEHSLVSRSLKSGWLSSKSPAVRQFEEAFAGSVGCRYAHAVSSGTAALQLALAGLGIGKDDEVIVPDLTFVATANAVSYLGSRPVLVDVTRNSWTIDPDQILSKLGKKTKAIIVVHLYGHPADMSPLLRIAKAHKLAIVEDAAEAYGARYKKRHVGGLASAGCFSFFGNKTLTTGEGGIITTNSKRLYNRIVFLNNHAMSQERKYYHPIIGYSYRMGSLQAALGLAQVKRAAGLIAKKRRIASMYRALLADLHEYFVFPPQERWARSSSWMFSVLLKPGKKGNRADLMGFLESNNIETRPFFSPLHRLPMYRQADRFPVSSMLAKRGMSLPSGTTLTRIDIARVSHVIHDFFRI
ncbi:MAG: hypothetical protein A3A65_00515 [Candidatus Chisholmbacteria bacterium RIFCSPLOWO2_01_FULL_49_14]|uniref:Aminotransferase DegT n=1 Tax=Candidatus Chisholmbacteria bacterium RIFCSPLOWO2_01_FULL_49_14 TaxID=1797593 RepID=A0A1G1VZ19_9BACT|nr:MAG: hypothetical protein A3A65_00515 [Candidatus Chisholmbacteria bacterium RIFCSPLOWO2_01_FULL_49_14]